MPLRTSGSTPPNSPLSETAGRPVRVLLIEDDPADAVLLQELLLQDPSQNFDVTSADSLQSGLDHLHRGESDVILLDLFLPDSEGLATFSKIYTQAQPLAVPIIILSGLDNESLTTEAVQKGAQDYLVKGQFTAKQLVRTIRHAMERQKVFNELEKARSLEHRLAYYDPLTALPNRRLFYDRLHQAITQAKRDRQSLAMLFMDLDGFKRINDSMGHSTGDLLLQEAARRLKSCIREGDTLARLGGDEFIVIVNAVSKLYDAVKVAKKIIKTMAKPFVLNGYEFVVTTSIGISLYPSDGQDSEALLKNADIAMYRAKASGKNNYQFYNLSMESTASQCLAMEAQLRKAIERGEFVVYYQPQVDVATGKIVAVEALSRWQHPTRGLLPPSQFIPLAEETGLIVLIDEWMMRTACSQNKTWQQEGLEPVRVTVNLSAKEFRARSLPQTILKVLEATGLEPQYLGLELTENNIIQDLDYTSNTLKKLKDMNIQLLIDDFGIGYSSLSYLRRLPISALKIDQSFVRHIDTDENDAAIFSAIMAMAHTMRLQVIAEGVATTEQCAFLRAQHCDVVQGFFFSQPLPASKFTELLKHGKTFPALAPNA